MGRGRNWGRSWRNTCSGLCNIPYGLNFDRPPSKCH